VPLVLLPGFPLARCPQDRLGDSCVTAPQSSRAPQPATPSLAYGPRLAGLKGPGVVPEGTTIIEGGCQMKVKKLLEND
jgi:hypothetical protein